MTFGEKLLFLRRQSGLSQEQIAEKLNVSRQAVSRWEEGAIPDMENVVKISSFFDCSLDYLMNDSTEKLPEKVPATPHCDVVERRRIQPETVCLMIGLAALASADSLPYSDYNPESAVLFCILLRMLYGCGLRRNEALKMETRDIDLNLGVLFVRHAKNDKQRYVPMDISLTELIRAYLSIVPQREYLFVNSTSGRRYSAEWARKRMGHLLQDCGIDFERVRKYERGPCLHCFRHTFVAKAFDQLLQTPLDFADAVPFISTYLGHCDLRETDKYLQANYDFFQRDHTLITDYARKHNIFPEVIDE